MYYGNTLGLGITTTRERMICKQYKIFVFTFKKYWTHM